MSGDSNASRTSARLWGLAPTLALFIGGLVLAATASIAVLQWQTSSRILSTLGIQSINTSLDLVEKTVEDHLSPARRQVDQIAALIEDGHYGWTNRDRLRDLVIGAVATAPQVGGMIIRGDRGQILRAVRRPDDGTLVVDFPTSIETTKLVDDIGRTIANRGSHWGSIVHSPVTHNFYVNVRRRLKRDGQPAGFIAAGVTINEVSRLLANLSAANDRIVYIRHGEDQILAHPSLAMGGLAGDDITTLPALDGFGDKVLANIAEAQAAPIGDDGLAENTSFRQISIDGTRYFIFERIVGQFGRQAVTIGVHVLASKVDAPIRQLYLSGAVAIGLVVIALFLAIVVSRLVTRPIQQMADASTAIGQLRLEDVGDFRPSMIREVNDLSGALNRMLLGLKAFETYVPKKLVSQLIKHDLPGRVTSESRNLTVMFTDIAGFTSMSETMKASEVASFINHHLTLLTDCIEAEGGTVDKYIGDAVMAFWGAPEDIDDAADHACNAALSMADAMAADNEERRAAGHAPVRIRIGLHTGPLVVGNIGSPSRMNYTIVGDTVNAAQRLESLGKEVDGDAETIILMSHDTRQALQGEYDLRSAGDFQVKGRSEAIKVYRLFGRAPGQA